jgi:hypothetical protein
LGIPKQNYGCDETILIVLHYFLIRIGVTIKLIHLKEDSHLMENIVESLKDINVPGKCDKYLLNIFLSIHSSLNSQILDSDLTEKPKEDKFGKISGANPKENSKRIKKTNMTTYKLRDVANDVDIKEIRILKTFQKQNEGKN